MALHIGDSSHNVLLIVNRQNCLPDLLLFFFLEFFGNYLNGALEFWRDGIHLSEILCYNVLGVFFSVLRIVRHSIKISMNPFDFFVLFL